MDTTRTTTKRHGRALAVLALAAGLPLLAACSDDTDEGPGVTTSIGTPDAGEGSEAGVTGGAAGAGATSGGGDDDEDGNAPTQDGIDGGDGDDSGDVEDLEDSEGGGSSGVGPSGGPAGEGTGR